MNWQVHFAAFLGVRSPKNFCPIVLVLGGPRWSPTKLPLLPSYPRFFSLSFLAQPSKTRESVQVRTFALFALLPDEPRTAFLLFPSYKRPSILTALLILLQQ